jgi:hypothetical protein
MYFYGGGLIAGGQTNNGELILPPRGFVALTGQSVEKLNGKWAILIPGSNDCDNDCRQLLHITRQVHVALGKDSDRVQRFYLSDNGPLTGQFSSLVKTEYPQLTVLNQPGSTIAEILGPDWFLAQKVYLVDPAGNIMMAYTVDLIGKPMLKDLKHLFKASSIG